MGQKPLSRVAPVPTTGLHPLSPPSSPRAGEKPAGHCRDSSGCRDIPGPALLTGGSLVCISRARLGPVSANACLAEPRTRLVKQRCQAQRKAKQKLGGPPLSLSVSQIRQKRHLAGRVPAAVRPQRDFSAVPSTRPSRPHSGHVPASRGTQRPWGEPGGNKNVLIAMLPPRLSCLWPPPVTCVLTAPLTTCLALGFVSWLLSPWLGNYFVCPVLIAPAPSLTLVSALALITCLVPQALLQGPRPATSLAS